MGPRILINDLRNGRNALRMIEAGLRAGTLHPREFERLIGVAKAGLDHALEVQAPPVPVLRQAFSVVEGGR